jgi:hypothetical protein
MRFVGVAPGLVLHSARTVDPFDVIGRAMKEITSKPAKQKTDNDQRLLANLEWLAGLPLNQDFVLKTSGEEVVLPAGLQLQIPTDYIEGVLREGAKKLRKGKDFSAGCFVENPSTLLDGNGKPVPQVHELISNLKYRLRKTVVVSRGRLMRTRPWFTQWSLETIVSFYPEVVNERDIVTAAEKAGYYVGLGDHRPKFGRFQVEVL